MKNNVERRTLAVGLIINIVCFLVYGVSALIFLIAFWGAESTDQHIAGLKFVFAFILTVSIVGIVFSYISLSKETLPVQKFDKQKWWPLSTALFSLFVSAGSILKIVWTKNTLWIEIVFAIALILSAVLIIISVIHNAYMLNKQKTSK